MQTDLEPAAVRAVRAFIRETWPRTFRTPDSIQEGEMKLPAPFVVPTANPVFHVLYYWDTYFIAEGLLRDGHVDIARGSAENFMHLVETLGHIPNAAVTGMNRSQSPNSSFLYRAVYEHTRDKAWLERAARACIREHAFWMALRAGPDGLNRPGHHHTPSEVEDFHRWIHQRVGGFPADPAERLLFLSHKVAEAENWDFTPRYDGRAMDFYPVDLNAFLYGHERNTAYFLSELGDPAAQLWEERAEGRRRLVNQLMWNANTGFFHDYDHARRTRAPYISAANCVALMAGLADERQAAAMVANFHVLEGACGVDTCAPGIGPRPTHTTYQWDSPNAWPPMQLAAMAGLRRYGFDGHARRIALKYATTVCRVFAQTGNLWEKYNAHTGDIRVVDEYEMPPMLGWTAGTFLYALDILGRLEE